MINISENREQIRELVIAAQGGDRRAFGELCERFHDHVFAVALRRLRNHNDALELCQDVFLQAMLKIDQLRDPDCFGGWIRSITQRMAINRSVRRSPDVLAEPELMEAVCVERATPLSALLDSERREEVRAGLARLGELDRATLEAFYVEGDSLLDMSATFEAPLGTIKRRLHVARKRLAKQVQPLAV